MSSASSKTAAERAVLVLDDESGMVNAIRRELSTPPKAPLLAEQMNSACVIADYRMPQMDGVNFLYEFAEKQPDSVRIMLSGAAVLADMCKERGIEITTQ